MSQMQGAANAIFVQGFSGASPPSPLRVRVFLSSPGDVAEERNLARIVLEGMSKRPVFRDRLAIDVVSWDDPIAPAPMLANLTPQDAVNRALPTPAQCDFTIVILWGRMGTPLAHHRKADGTPYRSGTEWEYESARVAGKDILLYRRTSALAISPQDRAQDLADRVEQIGAVNAFFASLARADGSLAGGYTGYETPASFEKRLAQDVESLLDRLLRARATALDPYAMTVQPMGVDPVAAAAPIAGLGGTSPAQLVRLSPPKPRLDELFEVLTDADEIARTLFRTEGSRSLVPYEVAYVRDRVGLENSQQALADALLDSGGRLLITGRAGIGKTRETVELAADYCARGWVVLVARPDADARFGPVAAVPAALHDARVLVIVDNLHARAAADDGPPLPERLSTCLDSLVRQALDEVRVIATARDEPRFARRLGLAVGSTQWREFSRFDLPDLTTDGLVGMLASLTARAELALDSLALSALVADTDRTPRTLVMNVDRVRARKIPLDRDHWLHSEGETWREKLRAARARHPQSDAVQASIHLLSQLGVPPRLDYIAAMGSDSERTARIDAVEALIDEGIVGRRQGRLALFTPEPLESRRKSSPAELWAPVRDAITKPAVRPPEWIDDLTALALGLLRADLYEPAIAAATLAIDAGGNSAALYLTRAGGHFLTKDFDGALSDLDAAIARDDDDANSWFLRGQLNYLQGNADGALNDLTQAARLGHDAAVLHSQCGMVHYQRRQWPEAVAAFDRALDRQGAEADGLLFFLRGVSQQQLGKLTEAETDLEAALTHASSYETDLAALPALDSGNWDALRTPPDSPARSHGHAALVHASLGYVRARLGRFAMAVDHFTAAIDGGFSAKMAEVSAALSQTSLAVVANARRQLEQGLAQLSGDDMLYLARGAARRETGQADLALADFKVVLDRGRLPQAWLERALLYLRTSQLDLARADLDLAVDEATTSADARALRGFLHLDAGRMEDALADLDEAVRLGRDDALVHVSRARARVALGNLPGAAESLDAGLARPNPPAFAWLMRAGVRVDLGLAAGAEADAAEALARGADPAGAHTLLGAARINLGRLEEAEADLSQAIALGRDDILVYRWRGTARLRLIRNDAEPDFDAAIARGDSDASTLFLRGCARLDAGRPGPALDDFEAAVRAGFADATLQGVRGVARERLGQHADAEADLDAAVAAGPVPALVWSSLAETRSALGNTQGAAAALEHALALVPNEPELTIQLSNHLRAMKRYADALRVVEPALNADPSRLDLRFNRANLYMFQGQFEAAQADLDVVIDRMPALDELRVRRSLTRSGLGDATGAIADLDAILARDPTHADALAARAEAHAMLGELDLAARDIAALVAVGATPEQAVGLPAVIALARGDLESAAEGFAHAMAAEPTGTWGYRLGLAHLFAGRLEEAQSAVTQTLATTCPGDARLARAELDALATRRGERELPGVVEIGRQLDAAWQPAHSQGS